MPQVNVTIAGRVYRMACDEGQEEHLLTLGDTLNSKIETIRSSFGEIGDMRMTVMAGIMLADELSEARRALEKAHAERNASDASSDSLTQKIREQEEEAAHSLDVIAEKVEKIAGELNQRLRRQENATTN